MSRPLLSEGVRADDAELPPYHPLPQIFDAYEKEFLEFTASIARSTSSLPNLGGGASRALASLP
tara:strand:+ start:396 stop:587 length:192 start_codon:yes stop_codon:yes gene_type:complete